MLADFWRTLYREGNVIEMFPSIVAQFLNIAARAGIWSLQKNKNGIYLRKFSLPVGSIYCVNIFQHHSACFTKSYFKPMFTEHVQKFCETDEIAKILFLRRREKIDISI